MPNIDLKTAATTHKVAMRAFLSHSTLDNDFVLPVARQLGRRRVRIDNWEFEAGAQFIQRIRTSIAASDVFVLFASKNSLESLWVKFEVNEAEELLRAEVLKSALVLIIDRETRPSDLPPWMKRSLIEEALSPSAASRVVEHHLNRLRGLDGQPLFIGRETLLSEFAEKLIPAAESTAPHTIVLGGLPGIGRRTFFERAVRDFLSVRVGPVFHLRTTDGLDRLNLALLEELGSLDTKTELAAAVEYFQRASAKEKAALIAQMLASCGHGNVASVIVDEGALLDSGGSYTEDALSLLNALKKYPDTVVGIIHTRRPTIEDSELRGLHGVYTRVPPLDISSTKLFLNQSFRRCGIQSTSEQINELAPYLEGYPPAIALAVSLAKEYGLHYVIADKAGLVNFQIRTFAGILEKLPLNEDEWAILRLLAAEAVLPLQAIAAVLRKPEEVLAETLRRLINFNLILPTGLSYQIAFPVRFAVQSLRGRPSVSEFGEIASHLKTTYWDNTNALPPIEVIEATIHAVIRSSSTGDLSDFKGFVLPSMIFRSAKEFYDRGGQESWERAQRLVRQVLEISPDHRSGLTLLFKIQVRLSQWPEAEKTLAEIRSRRLPEQYFLAGFLLWKKREFTKAVTAFQSALALGQSAVEVYHALATCLFRLNNLPEAERIIMAGLGRRRPNSLLLDLAAQVAIARGNYSAAEDYIDQLRRVRADADYHHRLATLLNARKRFREALPHAEAAEAAMQGGRSRFEVEATLIDTLIETQNFTRATGLLDELDRRERFGSEKHDVRLGLRCKLFLRQGKWKEAEALWMELEEKGRPVHLALKQEFLLQKIEDHTTTPGARAAARTELERLQALTITDQISLFATVEPESDPEIVEEQDNDQVKESEGG